MKPIHHTFGPHVDRAYLLKTIRQSYMPWKYLRGQSSRALKNALKKKFNRDVFLFSSGREALLALLRALEIKTGEDVIVQGYTCVVVPNAIHAAGGTVQYADINPETLNLTPETVEALITPRTRAVICQHTFGIPSDTEALRTLCDAHGIVLIEDMAHIIPDKKGPENIAKYGDYLLLSFGRDKAISGIAGGAVLSKSAKTSTHVLNIERTAPHLPFWHVVKIIEYATRMHAIVRPLSGTVIQKPILWLLKKLGFFVPIVTDDEKKGNMSPIVHKIPNICAELALYSLKKLDAVNDRRRILTNFYRHESLERAWPLLSGIAENLPLQKFPLFTVQAKNIREALKKNNIHLDDGWTGCVICPDSVEATDSGYEWGKDPTAEAACLQILSLPTHPTMTVIEAKRLSKHIDQLLKTA